MSVTKIPQVRALRQQLSAQQKDELIVELRRRKWTYVRIGQYIGMTDRGVGKALERIKAGRPGRDDRE